MPVPTERWVDALRAAVRAALGPVKTHPRSACTLIAGFASAASLR
jgi:hypothetical protein